jgi:ABC-type glycerol-3-phosphate transport system substrate-binding protein
MHPRPGLRAGLALAVLLLAACRATPSAPTATPTAPTTPNALTPTAAAATPGAESTLTPAPAGAVRVWLPPEFTPDFSTASGRVLAEQIQAFEALYPGAAVEVRTKAAGGAGGLLNALVTASNAAPGVLPDLVALRRDDLALAAAGGLVIPLEPYLPPETLDDFYPFAEHIGHAGGAWVGLPFAADARVLAYRADVYASPPLLWSELLTGTLVLPAGESSGLTVLTAYLARGGALGEPGGPPQLDPDVLADTLRQFQELQLAGRLPLSTLDYADSSATWDVFRERRAALAVTSAQWFLAESHRVDSAAMTTLPTVGQGGLALADGWSWALVSAAPERRALAAALLAYLIAPEQHAAWTEAKPALPTRAATLAGWTNARHAALAAGVLTRAQLQPSNSVLAVVGPPLRQALADVLTGRATPFAAATAAAETIAGP